MIVHDLSLALSFRAQFADFDGIIELPPRSYGYLTFTLTCTTHAVSRPIILDSRDSDLALSSRQQHTDSRNQAYQVPLASRQSHQSRAIHPVAIGVFAQFNSHGLTHLNHTYNIRYLRMFVKINVREDALFFTISAKTTKQPYSEYIPLTRT